MLKQELLGSPQEARPLSLMSGLQEAPILPRLLEALLGSQLAAKQLSQLVKLVALPLQQGQLVDLPFQPALKPTLVETLDLSEVKLLNW